MFEDARTLPGNTILTADVCVVGAGAAGIALALELMHTPLRTIVLESGGMTIGAAPQRLNEGELVGERCQPLHESRVRGFGGTTARWAGWCRPLDECDFETRDWIPHSGWPFGRAHLDSFYERASVLLELTGGSVATASHPRNGFGDALAHEGLAAPTFQFSPPTRFGDRYRPPLERAGNVRVLLHASAIEIVMADDFRSVRCVHAGTPADTRVDIEAQVFLLAAGGVENARLLLASNPDGRTGVGNAYGVVGRFFMEHPYFFSGTLRGSAPPASFIVSHSSRPAADRPVGAAVSLSEELMRRERLTNAATHFVSRSLHKLEKPFRSPAVGALTQLVRGVRGAPPARGWSAELRTVVRGLDDIGAVLSSVVRNRITRSDGLALRTVVEPYPNPDSRVTLSEQRDPFGRPRARLDWRLQNEDRAGARRLHELLRNAIVSSRLGTLNTVFDDEVDTWPPTLTGGSHHIGTTRMHADPRHGVVDADCRVHDIGNLFVTGSSVFPTAGYANPTMTIVALAIRLADHVKRIMAR